MPPRGTRLPQVLRTSMLVGLATSSLFAAASCGTADTPSAMSGTSSDAGSVDAPSQTDGASPTDAGAGGLRGVFVVFNTTTNASVTDANTAAAIPYVDGLALDLHWTDIADPKGTVDGYEWSRLDPLLDAAKTHGKKIQLSIVAADGTPNWFANALHLQYAAQGGSLGTCFDVTVPAPWDPVLLAHWDTMTAQLAAHLTIAGYEDTVVGLRLTGLNSHSPETHLPLQDWSSDAGGPAGCMANDPALWAAAGYSPDALLTGWRSMVASWASHFPTKEFSLALIDGPLFPPSNEADGSVLTKIIGAAQAALPGRLVLAREFLITTQPADPATTGYAETFDVGTSWQTNLWWRRVYNESKGDGEVDPGAAACGGTLATPTECSSSTFEQLLMNGVNAIPMAPPEQRTRTVEVFMPDPLLYGTADGPLEHVHDALVR